MSLFKKIYYILFDFIDKYLYSTKHQSSWIEGNKNISLPEIRDAINQEKIWDNTILSFSGYNKIATWFLFLLIVWWIIQLSFLKNVHDDTTISILLIIWISILSLYILIPFFLAFRKSGTSHENDKHNEILTFLNEIIERLEVLERKFHVLQTYVSDDYINTWVDPNLVMSIKNTIDEITVIMKDITLIDAKKDMIRWYAHIFYNPNRFMEQIDLFIEKYRWGMFGFFQIFEKMIHTWETLHITELEWVEREIFAQANALRNSHTATALDIQWVRLQKHIESRIATVSNYWSADNNNKNEYKEIHWFLNFLRTTIVNGIIYFVILYVWVALIYDYLGDFGVMLAAILWIIPYWIISWKLLTRFFWNPKTWIIWKIWFYLLTNICGIIGSIMIPIIISELRR